MLADRQEKILAILSKQKIVRTNELSELFNTSRQTIHSDIEQLDKIGKLIKVHGGAMQAKASEEPEIAVRKIKNIKDKDSIARCAANFIEEGDSIYLDIGTTVASMIPYLKEFENLTIITNSIEIAYQLGLTSKAKIILVGGLVRSKELSISGKEALSMLNNYYVDKSFIGVGGLSVKAGYTDYHLEEAEIRKIMIQHSKHSYALMDKSKVGVIAISKFAKTRDIDTLISKGIEKGPLLNHLIEEEVEYIDVSN